MDSRYLHLARNLVGFSVNLKKGEKVLVDAYNTPMGMVIAIVRAVRERGGLPFVQLQDVAVNRELVAEGAEAQFNELASWELDRMKRMDAYVAIRGSSNIFEMSDVPPEKMSTFSSALKCVLDWRVKKTKWVVLRWPSPSMAQQALMSTEAFRDFYFRVCTMDYSLMIPGMKALKSRMDAADQVRISGDDTDLCFSIKGVGAVACGGAHNIPDGEVFSSPVRDSVEGTISFNAPTVYQGASFDNIRLTFKKGKIVEATGSNTGRLNEILDQVLNEEQADRIITDERGLDVLQRLRYLLKLQQSCVEQREEVLKHHLRRRKYRYVRRRIIHQKRRQCRRS